MQDSQTDAEASIVTADSADKEGTTVDSSQLNKDVMEVIAMDESPENSPGETAVEVPDDSKNTESEVSLSADFQKYWKAVEDNPEEFNTWTYLLQYVEQENNICAARKAFDAFLTRYPYCYGYWKKYADIEKKHNNIMEADEVYRRGIQSITLSVDLWIHYLNFLKETLDPADPETCLTLRGTFEQSVLSAGLDFRSDKLWEMYINWETEQKNLSEVTLIYSRLLGIPTHLYSQHFQRFKEHIQNNLPRDFLTPEKFIEMRKQLAPVSDHEGSSEDGPSVWEEITDPAKLTTEIENMRHHIIEVHQEIFNQNEYEVSKRWAFEEAIKRPYFHVKPLEKVQLENWKDYLDFEIESGLQERAVILFERCVVACAFYEEYWIKYAKYMEKHSVEGVRHVYNRACNVHLLKKPLAHLLWAAFEEQQGNIEESRRILKKFEENVPDLAMVRLRRISLERRHGNLTEAELLLDDARKNSKSKSECSFYAIKLARHLFKVQKNIVNARKVLHEAILKDKENTKLYLNLLEMEYNVDLKQNESNILQCFDQAIKSSLPIGTRITFSQRKVEFLEDFGSDISKLLSAYDEHQGLLKEHELLKRKAENGLEQPEAKRAHVEEPAVSTQMSVASTTAATTDTSQAAYNYSNWYQYNYQNAWNFGQYYPQT
ncbi:LOW QUALITY PROTEIN: pre-mRNA-processing factor 39 [Bombina bombina]|uniref:LOW QUALITY PROTEIN: pre-mRNA-processing factor 39 n=1 Tax=Bombina bombina TaxID=8345 RepID=UPI00235B059C|nr:LOW QUALITY PROTEIN: pre-mRNA-processing factor 39 [Bombina bombina]